MRPVKALKTFVWDDVGNLDSKGKLILVTKKPYTKKFRSGEIYNNIPDEVVTSLLKTGVHLELVKGDGIIDNIKAILIPSKSTPDEVKTEKESKAEYQKILDAKSIPYDKRWGSKRLKKLIK